MTRLQGTFSGRSPLGRPTKPYEIASVATFLSSIENAYVNGERVVADGGMLCT